MFLDVDSEVLISGFIDGDPEMLVDCALEVSMSSGHHRVVYANPHGDWRLG